MDLPTTPISEDDPQTCGVGLLRVVWWVGVWGEGCDGVYSERR